MTLNYPEGVSGAIIVELVFTDSCTTCACKVNFNVAMPDDPATNAHVDVQEDHFKIVREVGAASVVLLKNIADALPLKKPRSLAIIGECTMLIFSRPVFSVLTTFDK